MADATVSRPGQIEGAGATDELFLKLYSGEVLTIFENENVTKSRTMLRTIKNGKSTSFPVMGRASAYYHTPGAEILGGSVKSNEKIIGVDGILIAPTFIPEIDEAKAHWDVRSHYSTETGRVLANTWDRHVLQAGVLAARTTVGNITDESPAGGTIAETSAGDFDDPDALASAFFKAAQIFDEKNIPEQDRVCYLPPSRYYALVQSDKAVNRDFGGNGSREKGKIWEIAGIEIVKTNNLPSTNITAGAVGAGDEKAQYAGDYSLTRGLFLHKSAVGTVQLLGLSTRMDYDPRRLGTLINAKYSVGHGVLRPEGAIELLGL